MNFFQAAVEDPRYINVMPFLQRAAGLTLEDVDSLLLLDDEEEQQLFPSEELIFRNSEPIVFFYIDAIENNLWVHVAALDAVMETLNVTPAEGTTSHLSKFALEYAAGLGEGCDRVEDLTRRRYHLYTQLKNLPASSSSVLRSVLTFEYMLANAEIRAAKPLQDALVNLQRLVDESE